MVGGQERSLGLLALCQNDEKNLKYAKSCESVFAEGGTEGAKVLKWKTI